LTPPNNIDLEKSLIGCLLQDKKLLPVIQAEGGAALFYNSKNFNIYNAIFEQAEVGEVDIITVGARVDVPKSYLLECTNNAPSPLLAESYAQSLKDLYIKREVLKVCHNTIYNIGQPDILNQIESGVREVSKQLVKVKHTDLANLAADMWEDYIEHEGERPDYMRTGLTDLDRMLSGIEEGEHVIIAARPGQGKTALAADIARNVAKQGKKVLFFTMEMSEKALTRRLVCAEAGINLRKYKNRTLSDSEKQKAAQVLGRFKNWDLQIIEGRVTVSDIKSKVLQDEPDMVIVDYLQLMNIDRRLGMTTNDLVGDNVTGLQGIAKTGPAVLTLSQLSRASEKEKRKPGLADLYESGKIEATGDKIIAPYREDKENTEGEIVIIKQKDGPVGSVDVVFLPESVTFVGVANEQEPPRVMAGGIQ